ncbi:hypothetical protein SHIRM173S_09895 [Streptomyces hirsutus]
MSARKLAMRTFRGLQLGFIALVTAHICLGWGYPWWWNLLPLVLAYVLITVVNRWGGGAPDHPRVAREPVEVGPPVTGRWSALNSPADRTPSHGVHAYGQTYAIDIVAEPEPGARPAFSPLWPFARRPADFPAFDVPLRAVADATVVRVSDGQRDHLSRASLPGLVYLIRRSSASCPGSTASSATTWCSTSVTASTPPTPTCGAVVTVREVRRQGTGRTGARPRRRERGAGGPRAVPAADDVRRRRST